MECRVKPYDGAEARTAIIHVSDDDAVAFPFIERLSKSGLLVWHLKRCKQSCVSGTPDKCS